jgi:hypothetical protein
VNPSSERVHCDQLINDWLPYATED